MNSSGRTGGCPKMMELCLRKKVKNHRYIKTCGYRYLQVKGRTQNVAKQTS